MAQQRVMSPNRLMSIKVLGVHNLEHLAWKTNTSSLTRRALQHFHFLLGSEEDEHPPPILTTFYRGTIEICPDQLHQCLVWKLQQLQSQEPTEHSADSWMHLRCTSTPIQDILHTCSICKISSIVDDPYHPSHNLFSHLPCERRFWCISSRTAREGKSFPRLCCLPHTYHPGNQVTPTTPLHRQFISLMTHVTMFIYCTDVQFTAHRCFDCMDSLQ